MTVIKFWFPLDITTHFIIPWEFIVLYNLQEESKSVIYRNFAKYMLLLIALIFYERCCVVFPHNVRIR